jgi:type IX secretion system PorP/SprF family membrane protein
MNYRNQWNKVIGNNFQTIAVSGDMNIKSPIKSQGKDLMGIGLSVFSDKVAGYDLNQTELAALGAYHKSTGAGQFLSLGFKIGLSQRSLNYENLQFEDQYVEGQGYTNTTLENLPENNISMMELALGLHYTFQAPDQGLTGVSLHHILTRFSFFNLAPRPDRPTQNLYMACFHFTPEDHLLFAHSSPVAPRGSSNGPPIYLILVLPDPIEPGQYQRPPRRWFFACHW